MSENNSKNSSSNIKDQEGVSSFFIPLAIVLSAILVSVSIIYSGSNSKNSDTTAEEGSALGESDETMDNNEQQAQESIPVLSTLDGNFQELDVDICEQDGKPEIFLFSTTWCSHCSWIKETFDNWAKANSDKIIAHHWELDINDDSLTEEVESEIPAEHLEVYQNTNPDGTVPTFVFGCKYKRVGNGYEGEDDLTKETEAFDKILQELI